MALEVSDATEIPGASRATEAPGVSDSTEKSRIRHSVLLLRRNLPAREALSRSRLVTGRLIEEPGYLDSGVVHCYVSAKWNEVETRPLLEECLRSGRTLVVPVVDHAEKRLKHVRITSLDELRKTRFGLWEPAIADTTHYHDLASIDLVVVPGVAFDRSGNRIGLGGGYYDRFLAGISAATVGLAYQFQIVSHIVPGDYDVPVDVIVTDEAVYRCRDLRV